MSQTLLERMTGLEAASEQPLSCAASPTAYRLQPTSYSLQPTAYRLAAMPHAMPAREPFAMPLYAHTIFSRAVCPTFERSARGTTLLPTRNSSHNVLLRRAINIWPNVADRRVSNNVLSLR